MKKYTGKTVQGGAGFGYITGMNFYEQKYIAENDDAVKASMAEKAVDRSARFVRARVNVDEELKRLAETTRETVGEKEAMIFEADRLVLQDESFSTRVMQKINGGETPERAVIEATDTIIEILQKNASDLFRSRCEDIYDLRDMLIETMRTNNEPAKSKYINNSGILIADSLTAAELMRYDISRVKGIVLRGGSVYSHASIIARAKNIPMIIGCDVPGDMSIAGFHAVLFADDGELYISPTEEIVERYRQGSKRSETLKNEISEMKRSGLDPKTLYANAVNLDEVKKAKKLGMLGVGLFRSEFLYLEKNIPPTEEKLFEVYKSAVEIMKGTRLVIRTADFDDDKRPEYYVDIDGERGIRYSLKEEKMLRTQLRALLRATAYGPISLMFPVVKYVEDVTDTFALIDELAAELSKTGECNLKNLRKGIMVETPEAVENAEALSEIVDFFSIGTNDLSRYALGISREKMNTEDMGGENRIKLLKLIERTATVAHRKGIPAMVCGELGSNPQWNADMRAVGVDGFSVQI